MSWYIFFDQGFEQTKMSEMCVILNKRKQSLKKQVKDLAWKKN